MLNIMIKMRSILIELSLQKRKKNTESRLISRQSIKQEMNSSTHLPFLAFFPIFCSLFLFERHYLLFL